MKASNYFWSGVGLLVIAIIAVIANQDQTAGWATAAALVCFLYDDRARLDSFLEKRQSIRTTEELDETFGPFTPRAGGDDGWRGANEGMW